MQKEQKFNPLSTGNTQMSAKTYRAAAAPHTVAMLFLAVLFLSAPPRAAFAADWDRNREIGGEERDFSGEIVVGATFPLTGEFEYYGQSAYYGAIERVRMINDDGGIDGKRLVVEWRDNRSDPGIAAVQVEELARDLKVPAVIGPLLSDSTGAVRELAEKYRFVAITPMATNINVVQRSEWIFRATYNNMAQAEALAHFQANVYGAKTVGILHDPRHSFSTELANLFARHFSRMRGRILSSISLLNSDGREDIPAALRQLADTQPDVIFAPVYALEAVEVMTALKELDINIRVCGSDTWDNELVFDASGRRLVNTAFASPMLERSDDYPPFRTFFEAVERAGMENPDAQAACAWDAVSLLAEAFKTGVTAEEVRAGLLNIRDMPLATGNFSILPNHESEKPVHIRVVEERDNRLVPVIADRILDAPPSE